MRGFFSSQEDIDRPIITMPHDPRDLLARRGVQKIGGSVKTTPPTLQELEFYAWFCDTTRPEEDRIRYGYWVDEDVDKDPSLGTRNVITAMEYVARVLNREADPRPWYVKEIARFKE